MSEAEVARTIETYLRNAFQIAKDDPGFTGAVDLFQAGYVDSVGVIETLAFINETFKVEVPDTVLVSDEFVSINGMAHVIVQLIAGTKTRAVA